MGEQTFFGEFMGEFVLHGVESSDHARMEEKFRECIFQ